MTLVFGLWLVDAAPWGYGYGEAWVIAAIVLWSSGTAMGARGGNREKATQRAGLPARGGGRRPERRAQGSVCATHSHSSSATASARGDPRGARDHGLEAGRMTVASSAAQRAAPSSSSTSSARSPVRQRARCDDPGVSPRSASRPRTRRLPAASGSGRRSASWSRRGSSCTSGGYWLLGHEGLDERHAGLGTEAGIGSPKSRAALSSSCSLLGWLAIRRPRLGPWLAGSPRSTSRARGRLVLHVGETASREPPDTDPSPTG